MKSHLVKQALIYLASPTWTLQSYKGILRLEFNWRSASTELMSQKPEFRVAKKAGNRVAKKAGRRF